MVKRRHVRRVLAVLGGLLIAAAIGLNVWTVVPRLDPDHPDDFSLRSATVAFQVVALLIGGQMLLVGLNERMCSRRGLLLLGISTSVLFAVLETGMRHLGYYPWGGTMPLIEIEPGGRLYQPDAALGYRHLPGRYVATLRGGYQFRITQGEDTLRITHPPTPAPASSEREAIWIFGCSYTHGWSINDEETYPWLLQQMLPDKEVVNFGVGGYGTVHSYIQFKAALASRRKPRLAVLAYGSIHDMRNTAARRQMKTAAPWNKLGPLKVPHARLGADNQLNYSQADLEYHPALLMRQSSVVHLLEAAYNELEMATWRPQRVSRAVIKDFAALAAQHGVELVVAGIVQNERTAEVLEHCRREGINAVDISVDMGLPENSNLPHDRHPSPLANQRFARSLHDHLRGAGMK